jgi:hypothetical protein
VLQENNIGETLLERMRQEHERQYILKMMELEEIPIRGGTYVHVRMRIFFGRSTDSSS